MLRYGPYSLLIFHIHIIGTEVKTWIIEIELVAQDPGTRQKAARFIKGGPIGAYRQQMLILFQHVMIEIHLIDAQEYGIRASHGHKFPAELNRACSPSGDRHILIDTVSPCT